MRCISSIDPLVQPGTQQADAQHATLLWCRYEAAVGPPRLVQQGQESPRLLGPLQALQQQLGTGVPVVGECAAYTPSFQARAGSAAPERHARLWPAAVDLCRAVPGSASAQCQS